MEENKRCNATIKFNSDSEDDITTFTCQKEIGHTGKHSECGSINGTNYEITWE